MKNGQQRQPPQQQPEAITFAEIKVFLKDGEEFTHPYAQHNVRLQEGGGGVLIVQETKGTQQTSIYTLEAGNVKRILLTPTSLSLV